MATQDAPASATLTGKLPFYAKPEPLRADIHGALGVRRVQHPLKFAAKTNVVPITAGEFGIAALTYPLIFAGEERTPLAVMGLRAEENLFIDADGKVDPEHYMPAFIRRYPFVFAEDKDNQRLVVCVDVGSDLVTDKPDQPFFQNGEPTAFTTNAIEFLKGFESERQSTNQLVALLKEHDLFEHRDVRFQNRDAAGNPAGEPVVVAQYYAVSIQKMHQLPADTILAMRDSGALAAVYAHNLSLLNWQRILGRAVERQQAAQTA